MVVFYGRWGWLLGRGCRDRALRRSDPYGWLVYWLGLALRWI
jgi:hypothetical protein